MLQTPRFPEGLSPHQLFHHNFLRSAHPCFHRAYICLRPSLPLAAGPATLYEGTRAHLPGGSSTDRHVRSSSNKLQPPKGFAAASPRLPPKTKGFQCGSAVAWLFGDCSSSANCQRIGARLKATLPRMHSAVSSQLKLRILGGGRRRGGAT